MAAAAAVSPYDSTHPSRSLRVRPRELECGRERALEAAAVADHADFDLGEGEEVEVAAQLSFVEVVTPSEVEEGIGS